MADGSVPIVLSPEPFARTTTYVEAPAGCTVRTMLASAVTHGHLQLDDLPRTNIYVDGERVDREDALSLILAEGQIVNVVVEPLGGGGGGKKDIGQILLTIAVIAVSMWVGGPTGPLQAWPMLARQVAAAAILTAGQMAVAAIFKPETNMAKANDRYALSSASNQYRPWASMPMALGEVVVAPDLAVKTFTQSQGEDQWIYGILGLHYGPCTAEDLKIGDTLVSSMGTGDVRVAYHLTPGPRTFSIVANDTDQLDLQEELGATVSGSTAVVRAASAEGERFEFDFFMPQGLYFAKDDGRKIAAALTVTIRYRPIDQNGVPTGSGAWASGLTIPLSSASSDPWRIMRSISLPLGRYEFEVRRSRLEDDNAKRKTDIGWTGIRAIAFRKPVLDETLSLIEFAVRASALNQGNLAPFTCRITPVCETWTGSAWGAPAPTSNPAAITRWLMTGPAPAIPLTKPQADVGLRTWAALCDQYNWKSHIYLTEDRKQDAVMQLLGMNGRASLFWDGTQLVSAPWVEKPSPRQLFAGANLKDHRWEIVYPDPVHALRVEFQNIDQAGEADEIYVYADGYGETADPANNILPATLVEALRLEGQQTLERAYRDGRWNLGARMHQRRVDSWATDIEHIVCRYGDRVRLAWDRVGTANATVRNRLWSGGLVSGLRLSQPVRMEPGRTYALDLRLADQVITGVPIVNPATTTPVVTRSIAFVDLRGANVTPRGGDLVAFGEPERISEDVEIIGITPGSDLTANMVGIRYVAPLLMAGETGEIPPLQSRLTRDRAMDPPMPTLLGWQADAEGVRIGFSMPPWRGSPITGFTARWRQAPAAGQSAAWVPLPDLGAGVMTLTTPPLRELPGEDTEATIAQVQISAMTADGRVSKQPLQVTVFESVISTPAADDWSVTPVPPSADGTQQAGFLVVGAVSGLTVRRVTVEHGLSQAGPWDGAYDAPPVDGVVRAPILATSGTECWIGITYWTAQGAAPSRRLVLGPYVAPTLTSGVSDETIETIISDVLDQVDADIGEGIQAGRDALVRARDNALLTLQNAKNALEGTLKEEEGRKTQTDDLQDRLDIGFLIDPIAKTGIIRTQVQFQGTGETFVQMNTRLVARDAENALQTAQVALDAQAYTNDKVSVATANLVTAAQMGTAISGAVLSMRSYADDKVATATAGLVAISQMNTAISDATLSLQSYTNGRISEATAGLATSASVATAIASSDLALRSYTDGQISTATADLISAAGVDGKIATASLALSSETDGKIATATANLISAAQLATALAGSELSLKSYTDEQLSTATALLASKAEVNTRGNALPNSTGANAWAGWARNDSWSALTDATWGARFETSATGTTANQSDPLAVSAGDSYVLSADFLFTAGSGSVVVDVAWETADGSLIGYSSRIFAASARNYGERLSTALTAPGNASRARVRFFGENVGNNTRIGVRRIKLERGAMPATAWTDDATDVQLAATAAIQADAITDAATKLAQARLRLVSSAAGGNPAVVELYSDNDGPGSNFVRISAAQIMLGANTTFDTANSVWRTTAPGGLVRVFAFGSPFGANADLLEWWGPVGTPIGSMTTGNGYNGRMTTAPYVFDNTLASSFKATASTGFIGGGRNGAGVVQTSNNVVVTVVGGTGTASIRWVRISGDSRITMNDSTAFTTGASATIGVGEVISAYFMGAVTKGGQSAVVYVQVDLSDNGT